MCSSSTISGVGGWPARKYQGKNILINSDLLSSFPETHKTKLQCNERLKSFYVPLGHINILHRDIEGKLGLLFVIPFQAKPD